MIAYARLSPCAALIVNFFFIMDLWMKLNSLKSALLVIGDLQTTSIFHSKLVVLRASRTADKEDSEGHLSTPCMMFARNILP